MRSFRGYLKAKCADPAFLEQYREQCCVCPKTVTIIATIRERGLAHEDVARQSGVDLEHLKMLEAADQCIFEDVEKLAACLGLSFSGECRKTKKQWMDRQGD